MRLIDANELITAFDDYQHHITLIKKKNRKIEEAILCDVKGIINSAPTIEERKKGKWLSHCEYCKRKGYNPSGLIAYWWCGLCEQAVEHPTNFCPNCGAEMDER